ncbi:hypothetical protein KJ678_04185 [Patescibacteria group bacterium]|nr:hypothetical protein [Patescibacteria group bacterium]
MAKNNVIITILAIVLVGGLGFYAGSQYQKSQRGNLAGRMNREFAPQQGGTARQGNTAMSRPVSGEITSMDNESVTVKMQDGSSKLIIISDSTKINKMSEGTKSDLVNGIQVTALGEQNSDGSITAQSVSIGGGMFQGMPRGDQPSQTPSDTTEQ